MQSQLINHAISLTQLNIAYHWLCHNRLHFPADADIWWLRAHWHGIKQDLLQSINTGQYVFSPLQKITKANGQVIHLWSSQDALVLKVLANELQTRLELSPHCTHIKGRGGLKQTVVEVQKQVEHYQFVCKTDVKAYYESIDHYILMNKIADQIENKTLLNYCYQVIHRTVEYGGTFLDIEQGISRGCSLSPIFGALYLKELDDQMRQKGLFYVRYMDDILIFSKTRWQNRRVVKQLNQTFNELKIKQHPDKTFIGKIDKGFDFLGYHFSRQPLQLATITVKKHLEKLLRLYEQQSHKKATSNELAFALEKYIQRWLRWCTAGLQTRMLDVDVLSACLSFLFLIR